MELFFSVRQFQPFKDNCVCATQINEMELCNYLSQKAAEAALFCKLSNSVIKLSQASSKSRGANELSVSHHTVKTSCFQALF